MGQVHPIPHAQKILPPPCSFILGKFLLNFIFRTIMCLEIKPPNHTARNFSSEKHHLGRYAFKVQASTRESVGGTLRKMGLGPRIQEQCHIRLHMWLRVQQQQRKQRDYALHMKDRALENRMTRKLSSHKGFLCHYDSLSSVVQRFLLEKRLYMPIWQRQ